MSLAAQWKHYFHSNASTQALHLPHPHHNTTPSLPHPPSHTQALHTATKLIAHNSACRDKLATLTITAPIGQIPIIQAVLRVSLYGTEGYGRAAAREVLRSFCVGNTEEQLALVSTMVPLGDDAGKGCGDVWGCVRMWERCGRDVGEMREGCGRDVGGMCFGCFVVCFCRLGAHVHIGVGVHTYAPQQLHTDASSFGSELVKALVSSDMNVSSRAAGVTSLLLQDNADAKQRALTIPLSVHAAPGNYLMPRCMTYVQALLSSQGVCTGGCAGGFCAMWLVQVLH